MTCIRPNCTNEIHNKRKKLCHKHYRKQLRADNSTRKLSAEPCAERLRSYRDRRWTYRKISDECAVSATVIREILTGRYRRVTVETYRAIMALPVLTTTFVTPQGFRRRMEALACMDWGQESVAIELGYSYRHVNHAYCTGKFSVRIAEKLAEVYPRLSVSRGPNAQAGKCAKFKGWAPPAAWDDDTIDTAPDLPRGIHLNEKRLVHPSKWTHCPQGHELSGANLIYRRGGQRRCRECHKRNLRAYRERQKVKVAA